jgi:tetratricopeptide (TPR) repeat protein
MSDKKQAHDVEKSELMVAQAKDFWTRNSNIILGIGTALLVLVGGYYIYKNYFQKPKEAKAADAMYKAEEYFRIDSFKLALNGDGQNSGFLKIMDKYSGTDASNLADFYAGVCYIKLDDNQNAVKYLKKFSTNAKQIQQRAYKLLGDAYGDLGNNEEAISYYKKAASYFEADKEGSAEALFNAAYLSQTVLKNPGQAIELYKELKEKFPRTTSARDADKYLAQMGVYNVD